MASVAGGAGSDAAPSAPAPAAEATVNVAPASAASAPGPAGAIQVTVPSETAAEFKLMRTRRKYKFMLFRIDDTTFQLHVDKTAPNSSTGADFLKVCGKYLTARDRSSIDTVSINDARFGCSASIILHFF